MTATMVAVDGGAVWADDSGGDGPPLVLLHPGVGDSRFWEPVLAPLTARYRVIRYDVRGYGESPAPTVKFTKLHDLVAVLGHYGIGRAAFAGCSMGGGSALALAVERPERVSALALLAPGIPGFPMTDEFEAAILGEERAAELNAAFTRVLAAGDVAGLAEVMLRTWGAAGATPAVMEQLRSAARAGFAIRGLEQDDPPAFERLGEIAVPAALMIGDADYPPLVEAIRQAAPRIGGCEFTLAPGIDHLPTLRDPDLVLGLITRTLARAGW